MPGLMRWIDAHEVLTLLGLAGLVLGILLAHLRAKQLQNRGQ